MRRPGTRALESPSCLARCATGGVLEEGTDAWKHAEIVLDVPGVDPPLKTHVFVSAADAKSLDALLKIVATARIEKK